ncbi:c-type cytochrome [Kaarinaea lacus]
MKTSNTTLQRTILILTVLSAILLTIMFTISKNNNGDTVTLDMQLVKQGEVIYGKHCASCHGDNLEGQPDWKNRNEQGRLPAPPHDETGHTWHHSDQLIFELTKYGMVPPNIPEGYESDMPAFENILSDDEIWAVLYFIKSRWPDEIRKRQENMSANKSQFVKP